VIIKRKDAKMAKMAKMAKNAEIFMDSPQRRGDAEIL
jgi:hypothetical protein